MSNVFTKIMEKTTCCWHLEIWHLILEASVLTCQHFYTSDIGPIYCDDFVQSSNLFGGEIKYNPGIIAWCCFQDPQQPQCKVEFHWQYYRFILLATLNTILYGSAAELIHPTGQKPFFLHLEINSPAQYNSWPHPNRLKWTLMCQKKDFQVNKYISQRHINKVTQTRNDEQ